MRNQPLPLIGQFYTDDAHPWAMQDVVNWLPAAAETEGTRTATMCKTPPGLSPEVQLPGAPGPIRGLHNAEGRVFAVSTSQLWEVSPQGVAIPRGSIGGTSRVRMAHNQQSHGNEVLIVNGSAGYVYDTQAQTLTAITDDGYPGAIDVVFLDGYFVQIDPTRRFAFNSDLADGLSYSTLDRFTSEVAPDRLVGLATTQNELLMFSERSAEFFENTGAAEQPFRSKRISMERGAASRYGQAHLDNTVFWLGNDGKFYVLDGYSPKRISTRPIEQAIRGLNWGQAFAFVWESEGHAVVYWTFPDGRTWGYDAAQGRWHRRASYGLDRWRVNATTPGWRSGQWLAGDFQAGRLWTIEWGYPWEYQTEFVSEVTAPVIHDHQNRVIMPRLEVLMDVGMPEVAVREFAEQPEGPAIEGAAPDGVAGDAYTYAYTVTPGDAAIANTAIRSGTLLPGLTFHGPTATISGTPTEGGTMELVIRTTDTNGLYADLTDTIFIDVVSWFAISDWINPSDPNYRVLRSALADADDWGRTPIPYTSGDDWYRISRRRNAVLMTNATGAARYRPNDSAPWVDSTYGVGGGLAGDSVNIDGFWWVSNGVNSPVSKGDGVSWSVPSATNAACLGNVVNHNGRLIGGRILGGTGISHSDDFGFNWTAVTFTTGSNPKVATNGNTIVFVAAVGNAAEIWWSEDDGGSFAQAVSPFATVAGDAGFEVIWAETIGKFVIANHKGQAAYSATGKDDWALCTLPVGAVITGMDASDTTVAACCNNGSVIVSTDAITFAAATVPNPPGNGGFRDIAHRTAT